MHDDAVQTSSLHVYVTVIMCTTHPLAIGWEYVCIDETVHMYIHVILAQAALCFKEKGSTVGLQLGGRLAWILFQKFSMECELVQFAISSLHSIRFQHVSYTESSLHFIDWWMWPISRLLPLVVLRLHWEFNVTASFWERNSLSNSIISLVADQGILSVGKS